MSSSTRSNTMPCSSARCELAWMMGPSARGSENGTPTSMTSAPAPSNLRRSSRLRDGSGCPAVTYGTNARRRSARSSANRRSIAPCVSDEVVADADAITIGVLRLDDGALEDTRRISVGEIDEGARVHQVSTGVSHDSNDRSRQHVLNRIDRMDDSELEGVEHDERSHGINA